MCTNEDYHFHSHDYSLILNFNKLGGLSGSIIPSVENSIVKYPIQGCYHIQNRLLKFAFTVEWTSPADGFTCFTGEFVNDGHIYIEWMLIENNPENNYGIKGSDYLSSSLSPIEPTKTKINNMKPFPTDLEPPKIKQHKISFCTTCKGRLHHLKNTLLVNVQDNSDYENCEFVVLNYNSNDGMEEWIFENMTEYLRSRKVIYIKTLEPKYFKYAHSKNMVTKFATGDIVCNLDADNFTGPGFAKYINEQFCNDPNIFLTAADATNIGDVWGRVCSWKSDFMQIRGYDEEFEDYGREDNDLFFRLKGIGRVPALITDGKYLNAIPHDIDERMENGKYIHELELALLKETAEVAEACILKSDHQFEKFEILLHSVTRQLIIDETSYQYGQWTNKGDRIELRPSDSDSILSLFTRDNGLTYSGDLGEYKSISRLEACYKYSMMKGLTRVVKNYVSKRLVNANDFGAGEVINVFESVAH